MTRDWKRRYTRANIYIYFSLLFPCEEEEEEGEDEDDEVFIFILLLSIFIPFYDHDTISKYIDSKFNYKNN